MNAASLRSLLEAEKDPARSQHHQRFFKTGPGEYAEGDIFWGLTTPQVRSAVKTGHDLPLSEVEKLLDDSVHEVRACGLLLLVAQFKKADHTRRASIIELYLRRTDRINNWDLVDISSGILGEWLIDKDRSILYQLAESTTMWEQRIAVVGTLPLIKHKDFTDILALAQQLQSHRHDLMHKAIGWMLREVGKQDKGVLEAFLAQNIRTLPRTTLRYAIERFPESERKAWLKR